MFQEEEEFVGHVEAVELSFGNIEPSGTDADKERSKFIAHPFLEDAMESVVDVSQRVWRLIIHWDTRMHTQVVLKRLCRCQCCMEKK